MYCEKSLCNSVTTNSQSWCTVMYKYLKQEAPRLLSRYQLATTQENPSQPKLGGVAKGS